MCIPFNKSKTKLNNFYADEYANEEKIV